jgi:amino acid adenylation domain-containing protein
MQKGMLFHTLFCPASGTYLQQLVGDLREPLDVVAFAGAWQQVIDRHGVLRTSFHWRDRDEPVQTVKRTVELAVDYYDWTRLNDDEVQAWLEKYLTDDRRRGLSADAAPLMRLALFQLSDASFRLVWTSHHALMDGRSRLLVLKEVFAIYEALRRGETPALAAPRPYADYIEWLYQQDTSQAESYWRNLLAGFNAPTALVTAREPNTNNGAQPVYREQKLKLTAALTAKLHALAEQHNLTLNTIVQGAWALMLSRYSGTQDVVFGATRACRRFDLAGAETMIGLFINTLPVRARLAPEVTMLAWLKELRAQNVAVRDYEHTPLADVQCWSEMPKGGSLFDTLIVFENYQLNDALRAEGEQWENREFELRGQTHYPLTLTGCAGAELRLKIAYDPQRFDDAAVTRKLAYLQTVFEVFTQDPERKLGDVPLLTADEQQEILLDWNDTTRPYPEGMGLHQLFEAQAARTPDAIAIAAAELQLTYAALDSAANRVARRLRALGVGPEKLVGVCTRRSAQMVAALLGVLKTGGAYVPLDPAYPQERLAFMVADSEAVALITERGLEANLPGHNARVVYLDELVAPDAAEAVAPLPTAFTPDHLAYVIYTSGSTGRPKGVAIAHRSAVTLVHWAAEIFSPASLAGMLAATSVCFDLSIYELFVPLAVGGSIIMAENAIELPHLAEARRVTLINTVPSAMTELIRVNGVPSSVVTVNLAGEPLPAALAQAAYTQGSVTAVYNLYGPTEDTTYSTYALVPRTADHVTIGRPVAGTSAYIVNERGVPVPVSVTGELFLGGAGLARGYLARPELTAERFVPDPFSPTPGARLYRTGDLTRFLPDGELDYLGRIDHQVKIRGFRIELGEIEAELARHTSVSRAVVVARADGAGGSQQLVAYVVSEGGAVANAGELKGWLRQRLPEHMIPAAIVQLAVLPLTPNGKVDRKALPAPDLNRAEAEPDFVAPSSPVEQQIAAIWSEVLGVARVGAHDNFFDLGGHSLLVMQIVSRLQKTFRISVQPRNVFAATTVAAQADMVGRCEPEAISEDEELARLLAELEDFSDEDAELMLANEMQLGGDSESNPSV